MPQLDFSTYPSQFFWLCVSFLLMLFLMSTFIVPKIRDILNQRQRKIDDYLSAANEFKTLVEEAVNKYDAAIDAADAKAAATMQKAEENFRKLAEEKEAQAEERLKNKMAESERAIAGIKAEAAAEIDHMALTLAGEIVRKMGWTDVTEDDIRAALQKEGKQ